MGLRDALTTLKSGTSSRSASLHPPSSSPAASEADGPSVGGVGGGGGGSAAEMTSGAAPDKYRLRVTAGPSYDVSTHRAVLVNSGEATAFESDAMSVKVRVRVRGYNGLPVGSPETSPYFSNPDRKNSQYSVAFSFVPKRDIPSTDVVWGNDLDHPVRDRLPPGFNTAFKIVKNFIDPGLECDAYADEPWLYGPALSCWFALNVGDKSDDARKLLGDSSSKDEENIIFEGGQGSGQELRVAKGLPESADKRRKFFLDEASRRNFDFERGRLYEGDFHNPYIDFTNFSLKLPGFSLGVLKYIGDKTHTLRYVCRRRGGEVFFVVVFSLLYGEELQHALADEQID